MEEKELLQQQQSQSVENDIQEFPEDVSKAYVDFDSLDTIERQKILEQMKSNGINSTSEDEEVVYKNNIPLSNKNSTISKNNLASVLEPLVGIIIGNIDATSKIAKAGLIDFSDMIDVADFIEEYYKKKFLPTNELKAMSEYVRNGGNIQDFYKYIQPIDTRSLSDEELVRFYYRQKMDADALDEFMNSLSQDAVKKKANSLREELGIIQPTPEKIVEIQKEQQRQMEEHIHWLKQAINETIATEKLKFINKNDKENFINSISEINNWVDDNNNIVHVGTLFSYYLANDITALVHSAYGLWTMNEQAEKRKSNDEFVEKMKQTLIETKNNFINL